MNLPVLAYSLIGSTNSNSLNFFIASPKAPTPGSISESAFFISFKSLDNFVSIPARLNPLITDPRFPKP